MTTETLGPMLSASIVGASAGPLTQTIDARWLMAYNAALSDALPRPVAHPLFAVCYEWPVSAALKIAAHRTRSYESKSRPARATASLAHT